MVTQGDFQREMRKDEADQVDRLLQRAYGSAAPVQLLRKLRKSKVIAGEMVVPVGDQVIGYYALSKMQMPKGWMCLGPVAIDSDWQGRKQGKRMLGMLSEWARISGTYVVAPASTDFCTKAGFSTQRASNLSTQNAGPLVLVGPEPAAPDQIVTFPKAFLT
ncbi:MAG: GNAT family N-acetyltransferase [Thalassovita sp.]